MKERTLLDDVLKIAGFTVFLLIAILGLWRHPMVVLAAVVLGAALELYFWHDRLDVGLFFTGAVFGVLVEYVAVGANYYSYAKSEMAGLPIYLPVVWGYLLVMFNRIVGTLAALCEGRAWSRFLVKALVVLAQLVIVAYFVFLAVKIDRRVVAGCGIFLLLAARAWNRDEDVLMLLVTGIGGLIGETIAVQAGVWEYHAPYFKSIGIPVSLPLIWGLMGLTSRRLALLVCTRRSSRSKADPGSRDTGSLGSILKGG